MSRRANRSVILFQLLSFSLIFFTFANKSVAEVTVEQSPNGAVVKIDGQLFTEYLIESGGKPILWPIIGPTGKPMTRAFPMKKDDPTEKNRSPPSSLDVVYAWKCKWHRFLVGKKGNGTTKHREFAKLESGKTGLIVTNNDWLSSDGKRQCEDKRTLHFGADADSRWIDFNITIKALDKPVTFGDTKEGTFGLRLAETLSVDAKKGGQIVNSNGELDNKTWGKAADWVDCHGPLDGQTVGIAILNHPSSFRYPTYWHVRTYGLFAANPFGLRDFSGDKKKDGSYTIQPGEQITLRYRVLFHHGDEKVGKVAEAFSIYSKQAE